MENVNQFRSVWVLSLGCVNRGESVWRCDELIAIIIIWVLVHNRYSMGIGVVWAPGVLVPLPYKY